MTHPLSVAVAGLGTVGAGVLKLLRDNADIVTARAGRPIAVTAVSARDRTRDRGVSLVRAALVRRSGGARRRLRGRCGGGADRRLRWPGPRAGRRLRSPPASRWSPPTRRCWPCTAPRSPPPPRSAASPLAFEAAVAGGIPVIKALREGLAGNRILRIAGILNGTCNYILTQMRERGREFAEVLADAQKLGYAEADPSFDIDGIDAAHKLAILAALAFGRPVAFDAVHVEGIRQISALDIAFANELGYRIKLLGIARRSDGGIEARVHPCMVPQSAPIARVDGVFNAVVAEGDFVGRVMLEGRGAGAGPTASAVVADLIDIARDRVTPVWGAASAELSNAPSVPMSAHVGAYYLRLMVVDRPGVIADVTAVLRDLGVSLESMLQRGRSPGEAVPVVLVTHETQESAMRDALARIADLNAVLESPTLIRIEPG